MQGTCFSNSKTAGSAADFILLLTRGRERVLTIYLSKAVVIQANKPKIAASGEPKRQVQPEDGLSKTFSNSLLDRYSGLRVKRYHCASAGVSPSCRPPAICSLSSANSDVSIPQTETNESPKHVKTKLLLTIVASLALAQVARAQGTAFTYQGRLTDNGTPVTGNYDLRFAIYDAASGGTQIGNPITNAPVAVNEGTFTVTLDFGQGIFPGANRWLQIGVRTNGSVGAFATLSPLQPFTASPYAITAGEVTDANISRLNVPNTATPATGTLTVTSGFITAATLTSGGLGYVAPPTVTVTDTTGSGAVIAAKVLGGMVVGLTVQNPGAGYSSNATLTISPPTSNAFQTFITPNFFSGINTMTNPNNAFVGSFAGNGAGLTNASAATLGGLAAANFWQLGGNNGSTAGPNFLGTTDNQGLELKVNQMRALRLEPNLSGAPNLIGGAPVNAVDAGIVGATISGGGAAAYAGNTFTNLVSADFGTVGGGAKNVVGPRANYGTMGGGFGNTIQTDADFSTVGGGINNVVQTNAQYSTIAGGVGNTIAGSYATIPGGYQNTAAGDYSFAAGQMANANHAGAFVWADNSLNTVFASTGVNQFLIRAAGGVGIGTAAPEAPLHVAGSGQIVALVDSTKTTGTWLSITNRSTGGLSWSLISTGSGNGEGPGKLVFFASGRNSGRMILDTNGNLSLVGALSSGSDRYAKTALESINAREVLEQVTRLPVMTWAYTNEASVRHLGPMAQDFYASFGLGADERHIATVDEGGVALAAIQGLNQKLTEELKRRDTANAELKRNLDELKQLVNSLAGGRPKTF
jgi:hypothetical protein